MGGNYSSVRNRIEGVPSEEVTLKGGHNSNRNEGDSYPVFIPCPLQCRINSTFKSLFHKSEFKAFVLDNLDSNTLVSSILENDQEILVLKDITYLQSCNKSRKKKLYENINKCQNFPVAGIKVRTSNLCNRNIVHQLIISTNICRFSWLTA